VIKVIKFRANGQAYYLGLLLVLDSFELFFFIDKNGVVFRV